MTTKGAGMSGIDWLLNHEGRDAMCEALREAWGSPGEPDEGELRMILEQHACWLGGIKGKRRPSSRFTHSDPSLAGPGPLPHSVMTGGRGRRAVLVGSYFGRVDLSYALLEWADLCGANLQDANLESAFLSRADLRWSNLQGAEAVRSDLHHADLRWGNLVDANMQYADLEGVDLRGAVLRDVDLTDATLFNADFRGAELDQGISKCASFARAKCTPDALPWLILHPHWAQWKDTVQICEE